jgi:hypothetical protein
MLLTGVRTARRQLRQPDNSVAELTRLVGLIAYYEHELVHMGVSVLDGRLLVDRDGKTEAQIRSER